MAIPARINRVAALEVLGYEKLFLLGESDKLAAMVLTNAPWMLKTNPAVQNIAKISGIVNKEELLQKQVDIVFARFDKKQLEDLTALGIPVLVSQPVSVRLTGSRDYAEAMKQAVQLFGQVMGEAAAQKAEQWCAYFDEKVKYVTARTEKIPANRRLKAYYLRGPGALSTQGKNTNTFCFGELAGADMFVRHTGLDGKGAVAMEEIIQWDPDVIFVGRQYSVDLVLKDARWQNIKAVRTGKVYAVPEGVFFWDGSTEGVLLMEFMAQKLYPELFPELNLTADLKDYYARFYHYPLTDDEAAKILSGLSPDGSRLNSLNN